MSIWRQCKRESVIVATMTACAGDKKCQCGRISDYDTGISACVSATAAELTAKKWLQDGQCQRCLCHCGKIENRDITINVA